MDKGATKEAEKQVVETRQTIRRQSVNYDYKPFTQPKNIVINRVSLSPGTTMTSLQKSCSSAKNSGAGIGADMQAGVLGNISYQGVASMKTKREGEKKEMQDLNERLANFIEQARFLEAENKALRDALNKSKKDFNPEPLKQMYQAEINEAKKLLDDANNDNGNLKVRINTLEDELEDLRAQLRHSNDVNDQLQNNIDTLNDDIARRIADNEMLKRKVQELEKQLADWKAKYAHVDTQLQGRRIDLQEETCQRLAESTRSQALEEELNFLRSVTDAEIKEYRAMLTKEDNVPQMCEDWKCEFAKCMSEIRNKNVNQLNLLSAHLESRYQVQEIKEYKEMLMKEDNVPQMCEDWKCEFAKCMSEIRNKNVNQLNLLSADLESRYQVQEIKEYKEMLMKEDNVPQMCEDWKCEFAKCMSEIRNKNVNQLNLLSADLESRYQVQLNEIRLGATNGNAESAQANEENRRLRSQITDKDTRLMDFQAQIDKLKGQVHLLTSELDSTTAELDNEKTLRVSEVQKLNAELEGVIKELQVLMDAKLSLELEIAAYHKLLEDEENRKFKLENQQLLRKWTISPIIHSDVHFLTMM